MDIQLKHEALSLFFPVDALCSSQESRTESVVPDKMPDIGYILDTDTSVYLRRKSTGLGKVFLEGEIHVVILYRGEDDTLQKLQIQMPCSYTLEAAQVQEEDRLRASLTLIRGEGRMINPRKVSVLVETKACAELYRPETVELTSDADGEDLEKQIQELSIPYIASVESKSFVVSEEFSLSSSAPAVKEILGFGTASAVSDQRSLGGKVIVQGSVRFEFRYLGEEDELCQERFSADFSQLMDIPDGVEGSAEILLTPEVAYVEVLPGGSGKDVIHLELHLTAQMLYHGVKTLSLMTDAYSLHHTCAVDQKDLVVRKPGNRTFIRGSAQTILELPEPAEESLFGYVNSSQPEVIDGKIRLPVQAHVFYRSQKGQVQSFSRNIVVETPLAPLFDGKNHIGMPMISEPYLSLSGGNLELRVSSEIPVVPVTEETIRFVTDLTVSDSASESTENAPSLILVRPEGRSLWELAKAYGSTAELIESANTDENVTLVLVPKAR